MFRRFRVERLRRDFSARAKQWLQLITDDEALDHGLVSERNEQRKLDGGTSQIGQGVGPVLPNEGQAFSSTSSNEGLMTRSARNVPTMTPS